MSDKMTMDSSGFILLADFVPQIVQEIRYYSTYNFVGDRIDGYEEPCAILTREAVRALPPPLGPIASQFKFFWRNGLASRARLTLEPFGR